VTPTVPAAQASPRRRFGWFIGGGLLVALLLAGVVSNFASSSPDGLESVTRAGCDFDDQDAIAGGDCLAQEEQDHELGDSPLADYGIKGIDNVYLSTGLAGVAGVLLTFAIGAGIFWLVRRRGTTDDEEHDVGGGPTTTSAGAGAR
jgi:cobalt/nickel transport protein